MEPLLTPEDVTRLFQITIAQVDALVRDGDLVAYRIGGEYRFAPAAIEAFLSAHTTDALSRVQARQGRGRYRAIADLLARQDGDRVTFAFDALNAALAAAGADPLADSAYKHRAWWANTDTHSHATAWMDQGWRVATVDLEARTVTFARLRPRMVEVGAMTVPAILDHPTIKVVGVGGSGCHAINRMIAARVHEVEFLAFDTDAAALLHANAVVEVGMGDTPAGAGGDPSLGRSSAAHSHKELREALQGADMIVIVAGMGGGTGTGAAPVVAQIAQDLGALTLGLITKPFTFEGNRRRRIADEGAAALKEKVDTLISVSCDRVLHLADKKLTMNMAFALADDVLRTAIQGISDTLTVPGLINLDFSDVKSVLSQAGPARMAIGRASGENRAVDAARQAISSPLLEVPIEGARGILLNIIGTNYTLIDVHEAAAIVQEAADPDANIILGAVIDDSMAGDLQVTVIATGFDDRPQPGAHGQPTPQPQGPTWPDDPPMAPVPSRVRPRAPLVPRMAAQLPPDGGQ